MDIQMALTQIALRLQPELLKRIDEAAGAAGLDRSSFIRHSCIKRYLQSSGRSSADIEGGEAASPPLDQEMLKDIKVADERSKVVIRDVLHRLSRLESAVFPEEAKDPF